LVELPRGEIGGFQAFLGKLAFNGADAFGKPFSRIPTCTFGIHFPVACEIHQREKEIAQFPGKGGTAATGLGEFPKLFSNFGGYATRGIRPLETNPGGAFLQVLGPEQGGQMAGNAVQGTATGRFFLQFELMPSFEDLG